MKSVIIKWNKEIFDGEKRLLPDACKLFSYTKLEDGNAWTVVFNFNNSPRNQGYISKGEVDFVADKAPKEILVAGFTFEIFDGPNSIASCEIIVNKKLYIDDIKDKIYNIESLKAELQKDIEKYKQSNEVEYDDNQLYRIIPYVDSYPFLFSLVAHLNIKLACEYIKQYFLSEPLDEKIAYNSNLSFFFYIIKKEHGVRELTNFIDSLSDNAKNDIKVKQALDEVL